MIEINIKITQIIVVTLPSKLNTQCLGLSYNILILDNKFMFKFNIVTIFLFDDLITFLKIIL